MSYRDLERLVRSLEVAPTQNVDEVEDNLIAQGLLDAEALVRYYQTLIWERHKQYPER